MWIDDLLGILVPLLPPAFGAIIGLKWTKDQTSMQKFLSAIGGVAVGVWVGPAVAELLHVLDHPNYLVAIGIITAMFGMDVIGVVMVLIDRFRTDFFGTLKAWMDLIPWPIKRS